MASPENVLVVEGPPPQGVGLAQRLRGAGFRAVRAKTTDEALERVADPRFRVRAALVPPDLPVVDLAAALASLRARAAEKRLELVVAGGRPGSDLLGQLRQAGVELALWEPFSDAALRFQLNRALDADPHARERSGPRAPVSRQVRVLRRNGVKPALLYTLSSAGAYLETSRPAPPGSEVTLELVLPESDVTAEARVLYTNVPGNLRRHNLPMGMGVQFTRLSPEGLGAVETCVRAAASALAVAPGRADAERSWLRRLVPPRP